jgi:hypothetical protein
MGETPYAPVKDRDEKMLDVHDLDIEVDPDESIMSDNSYVLLSIFVPSNG